MDKFISHTSWMRDIPDDAPVTTLNIPGTLDSCCTDGPPGCFDSRLGRFAPSELFGKSRGDPANWVAESPAERIKIIVMDYFEKPKELVSNVIKMNWRTGLPTVTPSGTP